MNVLDYSNENFQTAADFIRYTSEHVFLTGKAGTGKTTFLKYIKDQCQKKYILTAPTGVAAINAGGVTLHSFFQLPLGTYIENYRKNWGEEDSLIVNKHQLLSKLRLSGKKRAIIKELELLIIDEISMVRADILDAVDAILRHFRHRSQEPFGGVQVLMIGDLYQLPPVVRGQELALMAEHYNSPFFFNANCLKDQNLITVELNRIYRQDDPVFIQILNHIRNNEMDADDFQLLQERYFPGFVPNANDGIITLTSHNAQAWEINQNELKKLTGKLIKIPAKVKGDFPESAFPMEQELELKEGAQVMFIKNDMGEFRRYYNGKIGIVQKINVAENEVSIYFPKEKDSITIAQDSWDNVKYSLNEKDNKIEEEVQGTFTQFPIRLAWAVTIHKSQGLTFDEAVIDAGQSFAAGQVYVALSRLTSLKGMMLRSKITPASIKVDERIVHFMNQKKRIDAWQETLAIGKKYSLEKRFIKSFSWTAVLENWDHYLETAVSVLTQDLIQGNEQYRDALFKLKTLEKVGKDFEKEIYQLCRNKDWAALHTRLQAGKSWMQEQCQAYLQQPLQTWKESLKVAKGGKKGADTLTYFLQQLDLKLKEMNQAVCAIQIMENEGEITKALNAWHETESKAEEPKEKKNTGNTTPKISSANISLELFQKGNDLEQIAQLRGMAKSTIVGHLTGFIATGILQAEQLISGPKMLAILDVIYQFPTAILSELKTKLGEEYSYEEIKIVKAAFEYQKSQTSQET